MFVSKLSWLHVGSFPHASSWLLLVNENCCSQISDHRFIVWLWAAPQSHRKAQIPALYMSYSSHNCGQISERKWFKERIAHGSYSRRIPFTTGSGWAVGSWVEFMAAEAHGWHSTCLSVRRQRAENARILWVSSFSVLIQSRMSAHGVVPPMCKVVLPSSINPLTDMPTGVYPLWFWIQAKWPGRLPFTLSLKTHLCNISQQEIESQLYAFWA